jgi:hypothetical protein
MTPFGINALLCLNGLVVFFINSVRIAAVVGHNVSQVNEGIKVHFLKLDRNPCFSLPERPALALYRKSGR